MLGHRDVVPTLSDVNGAILVKSERELLDLLLSSKLAFEKAELPTFTSDFIGGDLDKMERKIESRDDMSSSELLSSVLLLFFVLSCSITTGGNLLSGGGPAL